MNTEKTLLNDTMLFSGQPRELNFPRLMTTLHEKIPQNGSESNIVLKLDEMVHSVISLVTVIPLLFYISTNRKLRGKRSHQLFLNLLVVHILFNTSVIVSNFIPYSEKEVIINCCLLVAMFLGLLLLSLERVMLIRCPFAHRDIETTHILVAILCAWVPAIVFGCVLLHFGAAQTTLTIITTSLIGFSTLVLTLSNVVIYKAAKRHDQFKKKNALNIDTSNKSTSNKKMLKASYVCFSIVASFVIFWLPYLVHNVLALLDIYQTGADKLFTKFVEHFALLNAIVDVVLFVWLSREMKKELRDIWRKLRGKNVRHGKQARLELGSKISTTSMNQQRTDVTILMRNQ